MNRKQQVVKNMDFFCKLANLKEFGYPINSFSELEKCIEKDIIFPKIAYFETFFIKLKYFLMLKFPE